MDYFLFEKEKHLLATQASRIVLRREIRTAPPLYRIDFWGGTGWFPVTHRTSDG